MSKNDPKPLPTDGKNDDDVEAQEQSQRIEHFDNAMQSYVEILFGVRNFSNFAAHCFIRLYSKDKKKFMEAIKKHVENCNEQFREKIAEVIEGQNIATILEELDQSDIESFQSSFAGKPVEEVQQHMYALKQEFIQSNKSRIEKENEELSKQLNEELKKYNSQTEELKQILKRKDDEISMYEEKIKLIDEEIGNDTLELGEI